MIALIVAIFAILFQVVPTFDRIIFKFIDGVGCGCFFLGQWFPRYLAPQHSQTVPPVLIN